MIEKHCGRENVPVSGRHLRDAFIALPDEGIMAMIDEIVRTWRSLRHDIEPDYVFDDRWDDLSRCLLLDGYMISEERRLIPIDASSQEQAIVEDELITVLRRTGLGSAEEIVRLLNNSTDDFRKNPPDYNGCMNNARVALQTIATAIAEIRMANTGSNLDLSKWGQIIAFLRASGFVSEKEEEGLTGVFSFVSPGSHIPVGLNEQEYARLGRALVLSMCYFLLKRFNR